MNQAMAVELAAGKDDVDLYQLGRKYGLLNLACAAEGIEAAEGMKSDAFSRSNPWVHLAVREGHVEAVKVDISQRRTFGVDASGRGVPVAASLDHEGTELPIFAVLFKGETVESLAAVAVA